MKPYPAIHGHTSHVNEYDGHQLATVKTLRAPPGPPSIDTSTMSVRPGAPAVWDVCRVRVWPLLGGEWAMPGYRHVEAIGSLDLASTLEEIQ